MEVSQSALARMLVCCFLSGAALEAIWGLVKAFFLKTSTEQSKAARRLRERLRPPQRLWRARTSKNGGEMRARHAGTLVLSAVADMLILVLTAIVLILILYETNDGQFRLSAPVLMLAGCLAYRLTLGRLAARCLDVIVVLIRSAIIWVLAPIMFPFRLLFDLCGKWMAAVRRRLTDWWKERKRHRAQRRLLREQQPEEPKDDHDDRKPITPRPPNSPRHFSRGTRHC